MNVEIERKFLMPEPPDVRNLGTGQPIRQGYLAEEGDVTVRIRMTDGDATLTVKVGAGLTRTEVEVIISAAQADALWQHTAGRRIEKSRHRVSIDSSSDLVAEVDVYAGDLAGLCTAEVEFESESDARAFTPPAWMGREVTGNSEWSNAALARHGRPIEG